MMPEHEAAQLEDAGEGREIYDYEIDLAEQWD